MVQARIRDGSPSMDMLMGDQIAAGDLTDWRKLAQGLHARYLIDDFGAGARFVVAVGEAGDALGHHPRVSIGTAGTSTSSWSATTPSIATTTAPSTSSIGDPARRRPRTTDHLDRRRPRARRRPAYGRRHRARPRHGSLRDHRPGVGHAPDRSADVPGPQDPQRRDPGCHGTGADLWFEDTTSTRARVSASTSRSTSRPRRSSSGSPPPSPRVDHRRRPRRALAHGDRRPGRQQGNHLHGHIRSDERLNRQAVWSPVARLSVRSRAVSRSPARVRSAPWRPRTPAPRRSSR